MKIVKEGAKKWKGFGVYFSLKETDDNEQIKSVILFVKNKTRVIISKAKTPWHGKDKIPHGFAWKKNTLYLNTFAIRFKK